MTPFLKLEDFLAPAPLPAIIAVLMPLGLKFLGSRLVRQLQVEPPRGIQEAAGFILVAAILAATAHFLAVIGAANLWLLRIMAWSLLAFGIVELSNYNRERLLRVYHRLKEVFQAQSFWGKAVLLRWAIYPIKAFIYPTRLHWVKPCGMSRKTTF